MTATAIEAKPLRMPWWIPLIQGIAAIIIGVLLWMNPFQMANALVWFIALYWLVTGIISLLRLFWDRSHWGWKLFTGILGILAGWVLLDAGAVERTLVFGWTLVIILGFQGIIMGIAGLIEAFRGGGWGPGIIGALGIVFGILLLANSMAATVMLPWVIGIFMIVGGIFAVIMAFRLRSAV
jgi:uncharacterized membrane protein HdeD (DUF308 family)